MENVITEIQEIPIAEGDKETLSRLLKEVESKITKGDKYRACIQLGKITEPIDIVTINRYLRGDVNEMRNFEFGLNLLNYFRGCAAANHISSKHKETINSNI